MAMDMFLKIEGVKGEAQDEVYAGEIDVLAWSWGMTQSGSMHVGGGGGTGKVAVQDVSITKYVDMASATMMKNCCDGKHFPSATLILRKAGENPLEYWTMTMNKVIISSISTGGSGGEDRLTENVTLNFEEFKIEYVPQKEDGTKDAGNEAGWNIARNVAV